MDANSLLDGLLAQDSSLVLHYLHEMLEGTRPLPEEFNWLVLGEDATSFAFRHSEGREGPHLIWARVAILAYQCAIEEQKTNTRLIDKPEVKKRTYLSMQLDVMEVCIRCIQAYGAQAGDPVRDVETVVQCFLEDLPFTPEEMQQLCLQDGKDHSQRERFALVRVRRKCEMLQSLGLAHLAPFEPELRPWFEVWEQTRMYPRR